MTKKPGLLTALILASATLLAGCTSTDPIESGLFLSGVGDDTARPPFAVLAVDAEARQVRLSVDGREPVVFAGVPLPRNQWQEGCHTNMSSEVMEAWQLTQISGTPLPTPPLTLTSACGGPGYVLHSANKTEIYAQPANS